MTSKDLETIDHENLTTITGGETTSGNIGINVPTPKGPIQVGVQGSQQRSNYESCVRAVASVPGFKPADLPAACGLPPA
jgi:hypothetical protein